MTLELFTQADLDTLPKSPLGIGSRVRLPDGRLGTVVCDIPSFGLLWLVRVQRRIGFDVLTVSATVLDVLS